MSEASDPALIDHRILIRPPMSTRNDIMERRAVLMVTVMEEASWLACALSLARSRGYGDLLEWIIYKQSETVLHAFVSIPLGMPEANALLVHFFIHHGAKIAISMPGKPAISIHGTGETSVQAIADIFFPSRSNLCLKPSWELSLSLPYSVSENISIKRALFSDRDVQSASQYRYMADIFLAQRFRDWRTIRLRFYDDHATNKTIKHVHSIHGNDAQCIRDVELEHHRHQTQDRWEFYKYHPQVVSLLGIREERGRQNAVVSSEYCLEDEDDRSYNDSGIDIPTFKIHAGAVQDAPGSRNAMHTASELAGPGQRWSVDEMITLSLLEAMELRNNANDDAGRVRNRSRSTSFRRAIAKFFRKCILRG